MKLRGPRILSSHPHPPAMLLSSYSFFRDKFSAVAPLQHGLYELLNQFTKLSKEARVIRLSNRLAFSCRLDSEDKRHIYTVVLINLLSWHNCWVLLISHPEKPRRALTITLCSVPPARPKLQLLVPTSLTTTGPSSFRALIWLLGSSPSKIIIWEEGTLTEELPLSDWPVVCLWVLLFD